MARSQQSCLLVQAFLNFGWSLVPSTVLQCYDTIFPAKKMLKQQLRKVPKRCSMDVGDLREACLKLQEPYAEFFWGLLECSTQNCD